MSPKITFANYSTSTIDDYYDDFSQIWARDSSERSAFDLWLHVVDHISRVARAIRKQEPPAVVDDIADSVVWLFSFIAYCRSDNALYSSNWLKFSETPSQIIWSKYPGICPGCFDAWLLDLMSIQSDEAPLKKFHSVKETITRKVEDRARSFTEPARCTCMARLADYRHDKEIIESLRTEFDTLRLSYADLLTMAQKNICGIDALEGMFSKIFSNSQQILSLDLTALHLLEEIGEASEAIKDLYTFDDSREPFSFELLAIRRQRMLDELADVFSWLFAIALKLKSTYVKHANQYMSTVRPGMSFGERPGLSFAEIIWSKYGMTRAGANWDHLKCPGCQWAPCRCPRDLHLLVEKIDDQTGQKFNEINPGETRAMERDLIFISYSHKDRQWLDRLTTMLKPLVRAKVLSAWDDNRIQPGQRWRSEIDSALSRAKVAVLLVSADFLASDFIAQKELPPLLDAAANDGLQIIWVPLSASMYKHTDIEAYQAAHDPARPLESLPKHEQDAALVTICEAIRAAAQ